MPDKISEPSDFAPVLDHVLNTDPASLIDYRVPEKVRKACGWDEPTHDSRRTLFARFSEQLKTNGGLTIKRSVSLDGRTRCSGASQVMALEQVSTFSQEDRDALATARDGVWVSRVGSREKQTPINGPGFSRKYSNQCRELLKGAVKGLQIPARFSGGHDGVLRMDVLWVDGGWYFARVPEPVMVSPECSS
ncbi:MAG: hypothetical protein ACQEXJ_12880 [Myxococcota bacterium]